MSPNDTTREIALAYARLGWPVLPLCRPVLNGEGKVLTKDGLTACTHTMRGERCGNDPKKSGAGKIPLGAYVPRGASDATTDASTINRWFDDADRCGHTLNLGLAMGFGRFALDVDIYKNAGVLEELEEIVGKLPPTIELHSGAGGVHLIYEDTVPGGIGQAPPRRRDGTVLTCIDVRSSGGYLVAPGSLHANGKLYAAEVSSDPLDGVLPAPAPEALVQWLRSPSTNGAGGGSGTARLANVEAGRVFHDGERKRSLVSLAGSMHTRGMSASAVVAAVVAEDAERCVPPLGAKEAERIARTVTKKPRIGPNAPKLRVVGPDEQATGSWADQLRRRKGGKLEASFGNVCLLLRHAEAFAGKLGYDDMALTPTWEGAALADEKLGELRERIERDHDLAASADTMAQAAFTVGCEKRAHPVRAYLEGLAWDETKRIDTLAARSLHVEDGLAARMVRRWMIAAVARVFEPGCKADAVLVLIGAQGNGKSTFFKALASPAWFGDSAIDVTNKDAVLQVRASWIHELAEIDGLTSRRHADQVKAFATTSVDLIRPPYARAAARYPRSSVFCGTTNREDFLTDPTGARRFWLVSVPDVPVEHAVVTEDRDQLWAEALAAYRDGEQWHLDPADELALRARAREHMSADPWSETVQAWLKGRTSPPTCADILTGALRFADLRDIKKDHETRIGQIMHSLGYIARRMRRDGVRVRLYLRESDLDSSVEPDPDDGPAGVPPTPLAHLADEGGTANGPANSAGVPPVPPVPAFSETGCDREYASGSRTQYLVGQVGQMDNSREFTAPIAVPPAVPPVPPTPGEVRDAAKASWVRGVAAVPPMAAPTPIAPWSKPGAA